MMAKLQQLSLGSWCLTGEVEFNSAEKLAETLLVDSKTDALQISLKNASGGSALLLVLLAWQRRCLALGIELSLIDAPQELQKVAELSHLQNLLPLLFNTKQPS